MSNKPKSVKRLVEYIDTPADRRHKALVNEAKKQGYKHPGSKPHSILLNIIPMAFRSIKNLRKTF